MFQGPVLSIVGDVMLARIVNLSPPTGGKRLTGRVQALGSVTVYSTHQLSPHVGIYVDLLVN